ncbi:MAG: hypothetical protein LKJ17_04340 [Oscillospiraceae bacterium]|jgi:hypothetical protein|nr:hypothetical protein [Oscillospiraceae bacterium]
MPENLRITAPVPHSDGVLKPNPSAQPSPVEPMEPTRVNRPNTQNQNTDSASLNLLLSKESVFGKFIQQLRQTPGLAETLGKLLFTTARRMEASPGALPEDPELRAFLAELATEQDGLAGDLLHQQKSGDLFSGPLFQLLRHMTEQFGDPQLDLRAASFLKAFDGFSSTKDTAEAILSNLKMIGRQLPAHESKQLALLCERFNTTEPAEFLESNMGLLKKEIIPFLSAYISKNSDYGKVRETISLLLQNMSILNVSSRENLDAKFHQLIDYCGRRAEKPTIQMMRSLYEQAIQSEPQKTESKFFQSLISMLSHSSGPNAPEADKAVCADIGRSLLLDNSVYMPFVHLFLPAVLQGRCLFSQIWIEKKDSQNTESSRSGSAVIPTRLYLTFTIQNLGYFEARVELAGKKVDLSLSCPEELLAHKRAITSSLGQILVKNGLSSGDINLTRCEKPKVPELILQKVMERKRMVDVTI